MLDIDEEVIKNFKNTDVLLLDNISHNTVEYISPSVYSRINPNIDQNVVKKVERGITLDEITKADNIISEDLLNNQIANLESIIALLEGVLHQAKQPNASIDHILTLTQQGINKIYADVVNLPLDGGRSWSLNTKTPQEIALENLEIKEAVTELMKWKGEVTYQTARGRAALNVMDWLDANFIQTKRLTGRQLTLIPRWIFRDFDARLYQALADKLQDR